MIHKKSTAELMSCSDILAPQLLVDDQSLLMKSDIKEKLAEILQDPEFTFLTDNEVDALYEENPEFNRLNREGVWKSIRVRNETWLLSVSFNPFSSRIRLSLHRFNPDNEIHSLFTTFKTVLLELLKSRKVEASVLESIENYEQLSYEDGGHSYDIVTSITSADFITLSEFVRVFVSLPYRDQVILSRKRLSEKYSNGLSPQELMLKSLEDIDFETSGLSGDVVSVKSLEAADKLKVAEYFENSYLHNSLNRRYPTNLFLLQTSMLTGVRATELEDLFFKDAAKGTDLPYSVLEKKGSWSVIRGIVIQTGILLGKSTMEMFEIFRNFDSSYDKKSLGHYMAVQSVLLSNRSMSDFNEFVKESRVPNLRPGSFEYYLYYQIMFLTGVSYGDVQKRLIETDFFTTYFQRGVSHGVSSSLNRAYEMVMLQTYTR